MLVARSCATTDIRLALSRSMKHLRYALGALLWLSSSKGAGAKMSPEQIQALPPPAAGPVLFSRDIKPIFDRSCIKCHGRGRSKGGFQLDTRDTLLKGGDSGPAVLKGKSDDSLLIELVAGVNPDNVMPKKGSRLAAEQVGLLRAWIDQGLSWDADINFARPIPPNLNRHTPNIQISETSGVNPIDQILKPYFEAHQFKPQKPVDDRIFA